MIELEHVGKQFEGRRGVTALDDVSLDVARGEMVSILSLVQDLHRRLGCTVMIVTHDRRVAESCARTIALRDGRIAEDVRR